jgi:hypothetical protein
MDNIYRSNITAVIFRFLSFLEVEVFSHLHSVTLKPNFLTFLSLINVRILALFSD